MFIFFLYIRILKQKWRNLEFEKKIHETLWRADQFFYTIKY